MAGNNTNEVVIAPGGIVRVAPVGSLMPATEAAAVDVAWIDLGYTSEDGVTFRDGSSTDGILAWQSFYPIRRFVTERNAGIEFVLRQWNKETLKLAFGGGTVSVAATGGHYKYVPPLSSDALDQRAMMVDWTDGTKVYRLEIARVALSDQTETQLVRNAAADLPVSFDVIGSDATTPYTLLTNDVAFS